MAAAICAAVGLAACGGDDSSSTGSASGTTGGSGAAATTTPASGGGTAGAVASAIESSRGGLKVSCPDSASLEQGAKFECDFTETDLQASGKLTVTVDESTSNSATISYDGTATGSDGLTTTASGSGIEVKK